MIASVSCILMVGGFVLFLLPAGGQAQGAGSLMQLIQAGDTSLNIQCPAQTNRMAAMYAEINDIIKLAESKASPGLEVKGRDAAYRFQQKLRSYVVQKSGKELATYFNGPDTRSKDYGEYVKQLSAAYEAPVLGAIFTAAIQEMLIYKTHDVLSVYVWHIYKHHLFEDAKIFGVMVEQQLSLFASFKQKGRSDQVYTFNMAYYLAKIKQDGFFKGLPQELRHQVDAAVAELPAILRFFFFRPQYCLQNKRDDEDLYTGEPDQRWGQYRRRIYSWSDKTWVDSNGYWKHEIHESSSGTRLNLKFVVSSVKFGLVMFMATNVPDHANVIAAWEAPNRPSYTEWSVALGEDNAHLLITSHDGFLMCNSDRFTGPLRRLLYGFRDAEHKKTSPECQWLLNDCSRFRDKIYRGDPY